MQQIINLPAPQTDLAFPLMQALANRRTKRKWKAEPLSRQEISNLLWAACGQTIPATKRLKSKRTSPSACNTQAIKIYAAMQEGLFLFDEVEHQLIKILDEDIRTKAATQKMMHSAPLILIYVSDYSKMKTFIFKDDLRKLFTSSADVGFISQNVYLYCAAANLNTAVISLVKRDNLHNIMKLNENEHIIFSQAVGKKL